MKHSTHAKAVAKLGTGERFAAVEAAARRSGARNPAAVAAAAGRAKYGQKKMTKLAVAGKRRGIDHVLPDPLTLLVHAAGRAPLD